MSKRFCDSTDIYQLWYNYVNKTSNNLTKKGCKPAIKRLKPQFFFGGWRVGVIKRKERLQQNTFDRSRFYYSCTLHLSSKFSLYCRATSVKYRSELLQQVDSHLKMRIFAKLPRKCVLFTTHGFHSGKVFFTKIEDHIYVFELNFCPDSLKESVYGQVYS